jgi:hypothetical protein
VNGLGGRIRACGGVRVGVMAMGAVSLAILPVGSSSHGMWLTK